MASLTEKHGAPALASTIVWGRKRSNDRWKNVNQTLGEERAWIRRVCAPRAQPPVDWMPTNLLRSRRRPEPISRAIGIGHGAGELPAEAIPDRRHPEVNDEMLAAFLAFLRRQVGEEAVRLLVAKMENELSQQQLIRHPEFAALGEWRIRQLMGRIREAARAFARSHGDGFLAAIDRLTAPARRQEEWASWSSPWRLLGV